MIVLGNVLYQRLVTKKIVDEKFRWVGSAVLGCRDNFNVLLNLKTGLCLSTVWEGVGGGGCRNKKNTATTPAND